MSGRRGSAQSAIRSTQSRNASASPSSGMMSLKTTPGFGKSWTSRIFDFRSTGTARSLRCREPSEAPPEQELRQLLCELPELAEILEPRLPALRAARVQRRRRDLPEQPRRALGGRLEGAQVPRGHAERRQPRAERGHVRVRLAVAAALRREQPELLQ